MQTQKSAVRFVLFVVILAILLFLVSAILMVPGRYTDQLLHKIENQTGVEILPVEKEYSFLSGKFLLINPELRISPVLLLNQNLLVLMLPGPLFGQKPLPWIGLILKSPGFLLIWRSSVINHPCPIFMSFSEIQGSLFSTMEP